MKCAGHFYAFPAHHKPLQSSKRLRIGCADALLQVGSFVRGGDWECRAYYVLCLLRNTVQIYENTSNNPKEKDKKLRFYGFLGYGNTLLVIIARGNRGKDPCKQGKRRYVTGSKTASL